MGKKVVKVIYLPCHSMRPIQQWDISVEDGYADMEVVYQRMQDHLFSTSGLRAKLGLGSSRELMMEGVSLVGLHRSQAKQGKAFGVNLYAAELKLGNEEKREMCESRTKSFPNVRANELIWLTIGNLCEALGDCFLVKYTDPRGIPAKPVVQHVLQPPYILDMETDEVSGLSSWVNEARDFWDSREVSGLYYLMCCITNSPLPSRVLYTQMPHVVGSQGSGSWSLPAGVAPGQKNDDSALSLSKTAHGTSVPVLENMSDATQQSAVKEQLEQ